MSATDPLNAHGKTTAAGASRLDEASHKPRKRRRLLRVILVVVILLVALIALAPTLVSTGLGRKIVVSAVNDRIRGRLNIQDLSLSWFGSCRITGLEVSDPQGRQVLKVERIKWDRGLWKAMWSGEDLGQLTVDAPGVNLYFDADWTPSLQEAFELRKPAPPKPKKPGKPLSVALVLSKARLHMVRHDGREYTVSDVSAGVRIEALKDIRANLSAVLGAGEKLTCSATLKNLGSDGAVSLDGASGNIRVQTDPTIDLAPIMAFAMDGVDGAGKLAIDIQAKLSPDQAGGKYSIQLTGLSAVAKGAEEASVTPADLQIVGDFRYKARTLSGTMNLTGTLGALESKLRYTAASKSDPEITWRKIMDNLADGRSVELPDFVMTASGELDLAAASQSVPALMKLRKDVRIVSGSLNIPSIRVQGGKIPSAEGAMTLGLTTLNGQARKVWQPMKAGFKVISEPGGQVKIENLNLRSSFASMKASGTVADLKATFAADLDMMRTELTDVFDLEEVILAGKLSGDLDLKISKPEEDSRRTDWKLTLHAEGVKYGAAPQAKPPAPSTSSDEGPAAITGDLEWVAAVEQGSDHTTLAGQMTIQKLNVSGIGDVFTDDNPVILHDVVYYGEEQRIDLANFAVASKLLSLKLKGGVSKLDTDCVLDLKGEYSSSWAELSALAKRLSPQGAKTLAMLGVSRGDIRITGPARRPDIRPAFRQVEGGTACGWGSGSKVYGLTLGEAIFDPALADARVKLPVAAVAANGGTLRMGFSVDLSGDEPMLSIPGKLDILEDVALNEELGREIISRVLPLFANLNKLEGKVSLRVRDVRVPLSDRIKNVGRGSGQLDLSEIRLRPAGEMAQLLKLMGMASDQPYPVKISSVDFELRDGGIWYDNLTLTFADALDLKFYGCVKFDDSVNVVVSVPVRSALLGRLGVKGPIAEYIGMIEGVRIDIPIVGTRLKPELDLSQVDIKPLVNQALKKMMGTFGGGLLGDILGPSSQPTSRPAIRKLW